MNNAMNLVVTKPTVEPPPISMWGRIASIFLPQVQIRPPVSMYEGDEEQARKERPYQTTSQTRWFQSDIEVAIHLADSGDLSMAARLSRSMRRDATYAGLLSTRSGGLMRLPKIFRGTPEVLADLDAQDEVGLFDRVHSPKELELFAADGIALGVAIGEYVYVAGCDEPTFVRLDPEFLRYRWADNAWFYVSVAGWLRVTPGDGRWVLHMPGGYQQPWTNALWPSLGRAYVAKEHAYSYRENYSGKIANPARVAVAPEGAGEKQKKSFWDKVLGWGLNTVFGLPPGWDVRLIESNGRGYEVFSETITSANEEFMIGVAGQTVSTTGGAGFQNSDIHATIRTDLIQGDGDALAATLNIQGMRPLINRLYGAGARGMVAWDTRPPADRKAEADAMSAAAAAINATNTALAPYGLRVDAKEMVTRFKIPYTVIGANTLEPGAPANTDPNDIADASVTPISPPTDEAASSLAEKMTEHGVTRCEHGSSNRCRLCGVERVRDFIPGEDGEHAWQVAWRPILTSAPTRHAHPALVAARTAA